MQHAGLEELQCCRWIEIREMGFRVRVLNFEFEDAIVSNHRLFILVYQLLDRRVVHPCLLEYNDALFSIT